MKFLFALLHKSKPAGMRSMLTDANIVCAGALFLAAVFVALIATDAYLFYAVRAREAAALPPPSASSAVLTADDIDAAIKLITQREQEYQALLNAK